MAKLVGMSFSFCIRDMVDGKVNPHDVAFISANTRARTPEDWEYVIARYQEEYWKDEPVKCAWFARSFIEEGRVIQPRLEGRQINWPGTAWVPLEQYNEIAKNWHASS